ncbi:hypothetical protein EW145_g6802 [Phellinidium pouzarii]|uniref:GST C-terminal domain-containing protein n=1 Tax=Phellinidium pouzarii TaxID=167371 RepID=A0A4S4KU06_9AGAM|nr:hypothetical protein EW145_g6802 [Phellinidium pouzarii]
MSLGTLWTVPYQPRGKFIRAAAAIGDLKIDLPDNYVHFEDNKKPEFVSKFPHGKIPAWEGKNGFLLTESYAIARYFASLAPDSNLLGSSATEAALVDQWSYFATTEIIENTNIIYHLLIGIISPYNKRIHQTFAEREIRSFKTLNEHLATRTFLVSESMTLADLVVAAALQRCFGMTFDAPLRAQLPHVVRFFEKVVNQPKVKDIFGETTYIEKAQEYVPA